MKRQGRTRYFLVKFAAGKINLILLMNVSVAASGSMTYAEGSTLKR